MFKLFGTYFLLIFCAQTGMTNKRNISYTHIRMLNLFSIKFPLVFGIYLSSTPLAYEVYTLDPCWSSNVFQYLLAQVA